MCWPVIEALLDELGNNTRRLTVYVPRGCNARLHVMCGKHQLAAVKRQPVPAHAADSHCRPLLLEQPMLL